MTPNRNEVSLRRTSTLRPRLIATLVAAALAPVTLAAPGPQRGQPAAAVPAAAAPATPAGPAGSVVAPNAPANCQRVEVGPTLQLVAGKSTLIKPQTPVSRILLGNPENARAGRPTEGEAMPSASASFAAFNPAQASRRPNVADVDVLLLSPTELYLLGKTLGATNVVMLDRNGVCTAIDVIVRMDTTAVEATIREILPTSDVRIRAIGNALLLQGTVPDTLSLDRAIDIAQAYVRRTAGGTPGSRAQTHDDVINMLSVAAPQQVMLEVKVAEVSKSVLDQYGINFARAYSPGDNAFVRFLSGVFGGQGLIAGNLSNPLATVATTTNINGVSTSGTGVVPGVGTVGLGLAGTAANSSVTAGITSPSAGTLSGSQIPLGMGKSATSISSNAQKQDGLVKVLAEPTVMAISGQEGRFLAGGRIFIPIAQSNPAGGTSITLEEKEFGVRLNFTPTVLADGRINLKVNPEVSELNSTGITIAATTTGGSVVLPSFSVRSAATTVQLMDGQSFAIGGLIKNNVTANISAFPFLGEVPVLGALFRSTSFQNDRSELVFVVTPRLARPLAPNHALPTDAYIPPTRGDMILDGRLEGRPADKPAAAPQDGGAQRPGGFQLK